MDHRMGAAAWQAQEDRRDDGRMMAMASPLGVPTRVAETAAARWRSSETARLARFELGEHAPDPEVVLRSARGAEEEAEAVAAQQAEERAWWLGFTATAEPGPGPDGFVMGLDRPRQVELGDVITLTLELDEFTSEIVTFTADRRGTIVGVAVRRDNSGGVPVLLRTLVWADEPAHKWPGAPRREVERFAVGHEGSRAMRLEERVGGVVTRIVGRLDMAWPLGASDAGMEMVSHGTFWKVEVLPDA